MIRFSKPYQSVKAIMCPTPIQIRKDSTSSTESGASTVESPITPHSPFYPASSTPRVTLDHQSYPHIFETILGYTSVSCLLSFRTTSRQVSKQVDGVLNRRARHVVIYPSGPRQTRGGLFHLGVHGEDAEGSSLPWRFHSKTLTLDVLPTVTPTALNALAPTLRQADTNLLIVRLLRLPPHAWPSLCKIPTASLVLFLHCVDSDMGPVQSLRFPSLPSISRLVVNISFPAGTATAKSPPYLNLGHQNLLEAPMPATLKEVVFLLDPAGWNPKWDVTSRDVLTVVCNAARHNWAHVHFTIVGFRLMGDDADAMCTPARGREYILQTRLNYPRVKASELEGNMRFVSRRMYLAEVEEEQFSLEAEE